MRQILFKRENISFAIIVYTLFVLMFARFYIFPSSQVLVNKQTVSYISFVFSIFFIFPCANKKFLLKIFALIIGYSILVFLVSLPGNVKYGFLHPILTTWYFIFPGLLCHDIIRRKNSLLNIVVLFTSIILLAIVLYNSLIQLHYNPMMMRDMTSSVMDEKLKLFYKLQNIGGFGFSYTCGLLLVFIISIWHNFRWKVFFVKLLLVSIIIVLIYFVASANFATLLLLTFGSIVLMLYLNIQNSKLKVFLIFITPLVLLVFPYFIKLVAEIYSGSTIGHKMDLMYNSFWGTGNVSEFSGTRSQYQLDALYLGLCSPIWGQNISDGANQLIFNSSHSSFLAYFMSTGLLGVYFHYKLLWIVFKNSIINYTKYFGIFVLPVLIFYGLLSMFNPAETPELAWSIFIIIPIVTNILHNKQYEKLEN